MAISMSDAKVDTSLVDTLNSTNIDASSFSKGHVQPNMQGLVELTPTGAALAGITESFATNVCEAIDTYCSSIETKISEMESVASDAAFKGSSISASLTTFVVSVKAVAKAYIDSLKLAERSIINSVATVYATQDVDIGGQISADSSTLESQAPKLEQ